MTGRGTSAARRRRGAGTALPTGTLTFLFTDIEGSTRLLVKLGERFPAVLETHQRLLRSAFRAGHEIGTEGDSFFVVFPKALDAVEAAVAAQRALATQAWPEEVAVRVRIGLHSGEGRLGGDNYVGLDVHRAARIKGAAQGGQVLLSDATRALVADRLPGGIAIHDLGVHRLRDLAEPERLHQLVIDGLPSDFGSPTGVEQRSGNLPRPLTSFHGREPERRRIAELLENAPLVTLTGPGGVGKTRLAIQVAGDVADGFADGAFLVRLDELDDPTQLLATMARALGIVDAGPHAVEPRLLTYLAERRVLIVLDNMEHLLDAAELVVRLLREAPQLTVLATSRSPLRVAGEREFPVPPLPVPAAGTADAEHLMTSPAAALFVERAVAVNPDFAVTDENAPAIAGICARLDGLPLAIELAASRVRYASPREIHDLLGAHLDLPGDAPRDLPARQRTLQATIDWSYGLLEPSLARLLDRLSVFGGSFDTDAVTAVANPDGELDPLTLAAVSRLVEHSLVVADTARGGRPRFRLLQTIRSVAAERLAASGERDAIAARHAVHFGALAGALAPRLTRVGMPQAYEQLHLEHDNLTEAVTNALAAADAGTAIDIATSVWRYWANFGHVGEGRALLDRALALPPASVPGGLRARGLLASGSLAYWKGDMEGFRAAVEEAVDCARGAGDDGLVAEAVANLAWGLDPGELTRAADLIAEALPLAEAAGLTDVVLMCRVALGQLAFYEGDVDLAEDRLRAVLRDIEAVEDLNFRGACFGMLGEIARGRGDLRGALTYFREFTRIPAPTPTSPVIGFGLAAAGHALVELDPRLAVQLAGAVSVFEIQTGMRVPWDAFWFTYPPAFAREHHPDVDVEAELDVGRRLSVPEAIERIDQLVDRFLEEAGPPPASAPAP